MNVVRFDLYSLFQDVSALEVKLAGTHSEMQHKADTDRRCDLSKDGVFDISVSS